MDNIQYSDRNFVGESTVSTNNNGKILISIRDCLKSPRAFGNAISALMTAKATDDVSILINTPGGSVVACRAIIAAMRACAADVTGILYGQAASCGAIIAINCDKLIVGEYAQIMFHGSSSMGANGNTQELTEGLTGMIELVKELTRPAVEKKFLTEEEFKNAFDKKCDVFISYEQLKQRGVVS